MALDYTQFGPDGPPSNSFSGGIDRMWWKLRGEEAAGSIGALLKFLFNHQDARLVQQAICARLYGNMAAVGLNGISMSRMANVSPALRDRISYNVISSVIDTVTAKIGKNKPKPLYLTSGGDYRKQRKAKKLNKFTDGVFYENYAYRLGLEAFRDGAVFGTGAIHVYSAYGRVKFERVLTSELYVDEIEGFYGEPRQLHRVKNVDRHVLADEMPEARALIMRTNAAQPQGAGMRPNIADMVTVRESWHLPSGPDAKDGRHVISVDGGTILEEPYERQFFPFAFFHWAKRLYGFWGQGAAERLQNIQLEINKLLWVIQKSMSLAGNQKIWVENGSKIVKDHINNGFGTIGTYTGTPPLYVTPPVVAPEVYEHLMRLIQLAFEQEGISQLSAAAQKPAGLDSGKALREYNDIESDRFRTIGQNYENLYLDLAKLAIAEVRGIVKEEGDYEVQSTEKKFLETIKWSDVDLDDEEYVMQCFPISSLPSEPAGRLQTVTELAQAGYISQRTAKQLMSFPDLEQVDTLENAKQEYLTKILEKMVDEGEYTPPEPFDDLQLAREMALEFYDLGRMQDLEPERLEMLQRFITQIGVYEQQAAQAMQPSPAPAGASAPPQASPAPPPVSDLLPNAPGTPAIQ